MLLFQVFLPSVDWKVYVSEFHSYEEAESLLDKAYAPERKINELLSVLSRRDTAFTYTNTDRRISVIVIGTLSTRLEIVDSLVHELLHLSNHIADTLGISRNDELLCSELGHLAEFIIKAKLCTSNRCLLHSLQEYENEYK